MANDSWGTSSRPRSYYRGNSSHHQSSLFRDDETSNFSLLDHNNQMPLPRHSSHRQYKDDHDDNNDDDDMESVLSFQRIKDERDYDRISYARKRSKDDSAKKICHQVRTSSPDRGGGGTSRGGSNYDDDYYAFNGKRYSKGYDDDGRYHYSNDRDDDDMRQSRARQSSRESHESSTISYIDYNDSFHDTKRGDIRNNNGRQQRYNSGRSRSHSPSTSGGDRRVGSTVRTDIREDTSTITFDMSGYTRSQSSYPPQHYQQQRQPIVGHDGQVVEYTKYRSNEDYSTRSKPQVPIDITVPSPEKQQQYVQHHHAYNGGEQKNKQHVSSTVRVHEMGSRRQHSKRRSSSTSKAASSRRNIDRKGSRSSSSTSKRSRSSDGKSKELKQEKSSGTRSSTKSTRSKRSNESGSSSNKSRRRSQSRNGSDDKDQRHGGDLTRAKTSRKLEPEVIIGQRSTKSSIGDKDRRQRDRRREMMTGRATKHLLDEDDKSSSSYSRSSVRHDVDDEGYCMHHPEIELMRLRSDGVWSTIRKKCPECIYEDWPTLMGEDDGIDEDDEKHGGDDYRSAAATPASRLDESSTSTRGIFNSTRLFSLHNIMSPEDIEEEEELNRLKRRLAARAYHFPGNTWSEDWMQYLSNTHTVLGLFFHQ
jgi:hypothetical protein